MGTAQLDKLLKSFSFLVFLVSFVFLFSGSAEASSPCPSNTVSYFFNLSGTTPAADDPGWQTGLSVNLTGLANGSYTAYVWAKDSAGNISSVSQKSFTINCSLPTCSNLTVLDPTVPNAQQTISASGTNVSYFSWANTAGTFVTGVPYHLHDYVTFLNAGQTNIEWLSPSAASTPQISVTPYNVYDIAGASCVASVRVADFFIRLSPYTQAVTKPAVASFAITKYFVNGWESLSGDEITYGVKTCPSAVASDCYFDGDVFKIKTTNLSAGTHSAQIKGINGSHNIIRDSNIVTFALDCPLPAAPTLGAVPVTHFTATPSWTKVSGMKYKLEYKKASDSTWILAVNDLDAASYKITGLMAGVSYDFQVTAKQTVPCSADASSTGNFTTTGNISCSITGPAEIYASLSSGKVKYTASAANSVGSPTFAWSGPTVGYYDPSPPVGADAYFYSPLGAQSAMLGATVSDSEQISLPCATIVRVLDFGLSISPPTASINAGDTQLYTVTVSDAVGNWDKDISLTCAVARTSGTGGLPTCSLSPATGKPPFTSTYTISGTAGLAGSFSITAKGDSNGISRSTVASLSIGCPSLPAPTGLSVSAITHSKATASWNAVAGADYYKVEWGTGGVYTDVASPNPTGTSYQVTGLSSNTAYNFRVSAHRGGACAIWSTATVGPNFTTVGNLSCGIAGATATNVGTQPIYTATVFNKPATLSVTYSWQTPSVGGYVTPPGNSPTATYNAAVGALGVQIWLIVADGEQTSVPCVAVVTVRDWGITLSPSSRSVNIGDPTTYTVQIRDTVGDWLDSVTPISCEVSGTGTKPVCTLSATNVLQPSATADITATVTTVGAASGNYTITVTGLSSGVVRSGLGTLVVGVVPLPNLTVASVTVTPSNLNVDDPHSVGAVIKNTGTAGAGAFSAALYLDCNPASQTCTDPKGTWTIASLGMGISQTLTDKTGLTISGTGTHTYYVKVDSGNVITESNESDNVGSTSVVVGTTSVICGPITYTALVPPSNEQTLGVVVSGASYILWKNTGGTFKDGTWDAALGGYKVTVAVGSSSSTMSWKAPASYDTSSQISAEAYNSSGVKTSCGGVITIVTTSNLAGNPNLTVKNLGVFNGSTSLPQTTFAPGDNHYVSGNVDSGISAPTALTFRIGLYVDCNPDTSSCTALKTVDKTIAQNQTLVSFLFLGLSQNTAGAHIYYVKADILGVVDETNETDNTSNISISILSYGCGINPVNKEIYARETIAYSAVTSGLQGPYTYVWTNSAGFFDNATLANPVWSAQNLISNAGLDGGVYQIGVTVQGASSSVSCNTDVFVKNYGVYINPYIVEVKKGFSGSTKAYAVDMVPAGYNFTLPVAWSILGYQTANPDTNGDGSLDVWWPAKSGLPVGLSLSLSPSTICTPDCITTVNISADTTAVVGTYYILLQGQATAPNGKPLLKSYWTEVIVSEVSTAKGNLEVSVWEDSAVKNCSQDAGEGNMSGVVVSASPEGGGSPVSGTTDSSGDVLFSNLAVGKYQVTVVPNAGYTSSGGCSASVVVTVEDGKTTYYNWALVKPENPAWFQTYDGDVHTNSSLVDLIKTGEYLIKASWDESGGVCTARAGLDLGSGSASSNNWAEGAYTHTIPLTSFEFPGTYSTLSGWNDLEAGEVYELSDGNINNTVNYKVSGSGFATAIYRGDLRIGNDIRSNDLNKTGLVFYIEGNVDIDVNALRLDAIVLATGTITVESRGDKKDNPIEVNGALYGDKIVLERNMYDTSGPTAKNELPAEVVKFMPIYMVGSIPKELQQVKIYWVLE